MSHFPPFPPPGRYSPSRAYGDGFLPPPQLPNATAQPPYIPGSSAPPPLPSSYRPYDAYGSESSRPFPYEQPRRPYETEAYDPYQPTSTNAYTPGVPEMRIPPPTYPPRSVPPAKIARHSPPRPAAPPLRAEHRNVEELNVLTEATTVNISGQTIAVHALPPSHLPIDKYIAMNRVDAIEIHRQLCMNSAAIWYADGSSRAGEGWSAAVEWIIDDTRSGSKMRGCLANADALEAELGGICKAAEGFHELLQQSIKDGKPMSHDLIVFCDSQAAIVGIDTSSRPEALRFDKLWRSICSEYLHARLKLAWLPKGSGIEGHILANKIATVGASNSYLKRKKENTLPDEHRRPGGGDPAPGGSSEAGPWQRGDSDPSRRKTPYERPRPLPISPLPHDTGLRLDLAPAPQSHQVEPEPEDETGQPREGSIFVTHFPDEVSAKDLGILFAQYGDILAVDIYHISPSHPRFAFVAYSDPAMGLAAIADLDRKPVNLNTAFALQHQEDLAVWSRWSGQLTVVLSEPPRLVPISVSDNFPDLPDWALGVTRDQRSDERERREVDMQINEDREPSPPSSINRKRDRQSLTAPVAHSSPSTIDSPSPRKRARQLPNTDQEPTEAHPINIKLEPGVGTNGQPDINQPHQTPLMPPFPPTNSDALKPALGDPPYLPRPTVLPPTPNTAERPVMTNEQFRSPPRQPSLEANSTAGGSKRPLTNSASEPQEYPIKVGPKTLRAQIDLVRRSFGKVEVTNWIAHACFVSSDLDQARRALQEDLYATDTAFLTGRDLEKTLAGRGYTPQRVDNFITKVLKVLDGIAMAEEEEDENAKAENSSVEDLQKELNLVLSKYPEQTREAVDSAARLMEYLIRGKEAQDRKRLEIERRVKVLEGMVKIGEVVSGVVRFLLTEDK